MRKEIVKKWFSNPMYYNSDTIRSIEIEKGHTVDIALIYSGRNRGKSFDMCARALYDAWESNGENQFGYCRRLKEECANYMVEQYFNDKLEFIKDISHGKADCIVVYNSIIYFGKTNETGKRERLFKIGNVFALSISRQYKSLQFPNITRLIFEEVFTDGAYLPDEPRKLLNLISTIQRSRDNFVCFMVSNTVSRVNPYADFFGLNIIKQQAGTIERYKLNKGIYDDNGREQFYFIACEYLADANNEIQQTRKNRHTMNTSVLTNSWDEQRLYPTARQSIIDEYETIYRCVFQNGIFSFFATMKELPINFQDYMNAIYDDEPVPRLVDETMPILFVTRKTTPYKHDVRLFTSEPVVFPLATRGMLALCDTDKLVAKLIEIGHTYYANNLIANEFSQCYSQLKSCRGI